MIKRDNNRQPNRNPNEARGYYQSMYEKYMKAAKDNRLAGDVVVAEYNLQHAEHYVRLMSEKFCFQQTQTPKEAPVTETSQQKSEEVSPTQKRKPQKRNVARRVSEEENTSE